MHFEITKNLKRVLNIKVKYVALLSLLVHKAITQKILKKTKYPQVNHNFSLTERLIKNIVVRHYWFLEINTFPSYLYHILNLKFSSINIISEKKTI